jgi:hypothetical protein
MMSLDATQMLRLTLSAWVKDESYGLARMIGQ